MESTSKVVEQDLAQFAIEAHGGLERWNRFSTISAHLIQGGVFWGAKGKAGVLGDVTVKVDLRNEKVSHWPFGSEDRRSRFEPQRVALENANGEVIEELLQPRSAVALLNEPCGPDDAAVKELMSGNICRCGAYANIVAAIQQVRKNV